MMHAQCKHNHHTLPQCFRAAGVGFCPHGRSRQVSLMSLVPRAYSLLCRYLLEEVRTRVETEDDEVRAAGRTYRTPRRLPPPFSRGGPLSRDLAA